MTTPTRITLADLESRPGWRQPGDSPTPNTGPTIPRGTCLACGTAGEHRYVRKVWATGAGWHIMCACVACGGNARGAGQWVARSEVEIMGYAPDSLPESDTPDGGQGRLL